MSPPPTQPLPRPAAGITAAHDPTLLNWIVYAARSRAVCILFIVGSFPQRLRQAVALSPPTSRLVLPHLALPIPHLELLQGTQEPTRSPSTFCQQRVEVLQYGAPVDLQQLARRLPISPATVIRGWRPSQPPDPTPSCAHTLGQATAIGSLVGWFCPPPPPPSNGSPALCPPAALTGISSETLRAFPPALAARGGAPKLSQLLAYMHIPAADRTLISRRLHQQWITDLLGLHHSFVEKVREYETRHNLRMPARVSGPEAGTSAIGPPTPPSPPIPTPFASHPIFVSLNDQCHSSTSKEHASVQRERCIKRARTRLTKLAARLAPTNLLRQPCGGICRKQCHPTGPCTLRCGHEDAGLNLRFQPCIHCGGCTPLPPSDPSVGWGAYA